MRHFLIGFLFLLSFNDLYAQDLGERVKLSLLTGLQQEHFQWSIAGNMDGQNPNVYSELKWKAIKSRKIGVSLELLFFKRFLFLGNYDHTYIHSGRAYDMDYHGDDRTSVIYAEGFDASTGNAYSWKTGIGYDLVKKTKFSLKPFLGFGISHQLYSVLDYSGKFGLLNSSYNAVWKGPFIKINSSAGLIRNVNLVSGVAYSQVNFNGKGNWNLIEAFKHPVSFRQGARGYGIEASSGLLIFLTRKIGFNIGADYFRWVTGTGVDELYLATGESDKTRFNEATREGLSLHIGVFSGFSLK
ncbi:hypothetical protein DBR11_19205 [Pedobacter sp. HMWF019]|uniref:hypothetical protein n=1 Tax=Pedobacter sp. HMWF019 TaxID=2056856 RepID=UPI000D3C5C45|nr:hypothetical protein [Pedobacter sp. HMWF019]PTS96407.1 hypothetical protein DBR11_19205 [Pedobacter sp. HMWF019]